MAKAKQIKTFLWFDGQAEEAAKFYASSALGELFDIRTLKEAAK